MTILGISLTKIALCLTIAVVSSLLLTLGIAWFVARLPEDFLTERHRGRAGLTPHRWHMKLLKNVGGGLLLLAGLVLALPGVPGPGLVVGMVGFLLLDFPGKHRLECRVLAHPRVLAQVNRMRTRWGRPPLHRPTVPCAPDDGAAPRPV